jgi:hypothetical protein
VPVETETKLREYTVPGRPDDAISSVRVLITAGPHASISVWNRGGLAGTLIVEPRDVAVIVSRLTGARRVSWDLVDSDPI